MTLTVVLFIVSIHSATWMHQVDLPRQRTLGDLDSARRVLSSGRAITVPAAPNESATKATATTARASAVVKRLVEDSTRPEEAVAFHTSRARTGAARRNRLPRLEFTPYKKVCKPR